MNSEQQVAFSHTDLAAAQFRHASFLFLGSLIGAIAALIYAAKFGMSGVDVALLIVFYAIAILGISVGYHRHFSHRSFKAKPWVRVALAMMGSTAGQGSLFYWVSNHRRHHQFSDKPNDVHSPRVYGKETLGMIEGLWYAQIKFAWDHTITNPLLYTPDLVGDKSLRAVNQRYLLLFWTGLLLPGLIGGLATMSFTGAISGFLYGGLLRLFLSLQFSNTINSITHYFGTRRFVTTDESRNNVFVAFVTFGEGWHNNHHAFQTSAHIGLKWWEFDFGRYFIQMLESVNLVWDIKRPSASEIASKLMLPSKQVRQ